MKGRNLLRQFGYNVTRFSDGLRGTPRRRIVFVHVPKTGGISIVAHFKSYVGSKRSGKTIRFEDFDGDMDRFAQGAKSARFVTGHMPWLAVTACRDEDTFLFTVLRDPFDRLRSLYHFITNLPETWYRAPEIDEIRKMSMEEFLTSRDVKVRFHSDNFIARQFSSSCEILPQTHDDRVRLAEEAIANISSLDLVGFNDEMDEVFMGVVEAAGLPLPSKGHHLNATKHLVGSESGQVEVSRSLSDDMRELARPLVESDLLVYEHFLKIRRQQSEL